MNNRLLALRVFARVARTGSFSIAGRELGLSQPSASRVLAALERDVGASLLLRSTRSLSLTDAGAGYLKRVEPILAALDEADELLRGGDVLRGTLRVALSSSLTAREIAELLPSFMTRHSALRVELLCTDGQHDGVDVVLSLESGQCAVERKVGGSARVLVASPGYLQRAGVPHESGELAVHSIIAGPTSPAANRLAVSSSDAVLACAVAGLGIASTSLASCRTDLARGALVRVLRDWDAGSVAVYAGFPGGHAARVAALVFVDHLCDAMALIDANSDASHPRGSTSDLPAGAA